MVTVNIPRDNPDKYHRYKMEAIQSKIEGKGNGIKTVIVNLNSVAHSLAREPAHIIKFFGFELGAQTNTNPADDRWIINGAHEAAKLQEHLDVFISKFVICKPCGNPETDMTFPDGRFVLQCKACGRPSEVDIRHKLSSFILKSAPKKGKKDKSTKKADRKARKEREAQAIANGNGNGNGNGAEESDDGSPNGSNSDHADDHNNTGKEANSGDDDDDEVEDKEVKWSVDTSEAAVKARAQELPDDFKRTVAIHGDDEDEEGVVSVYDQLGSWILKEAEEKGGVGKVESIAIYLKAKELGIEKKHRTLTVLAQTIFDDDIVNQIKPHAGMLKRMTDISDKHVKAFLGGTERFVGNEKPHLLPKVFPIFQEYYYKDLVSEEAFKAWGKTVSKKYVDIATSRKVRKAAAPFFTWLEEASEASDDSD